MKKIIYTDLQKNAPESFCNKLKVFFKLDDDGVLTMPLSELSKIEDLTFTEYFQLFKAGAAETKMFKLFLIHIAAKGNQYLGNNSISRDAGYIGAGYIFGAFSKDAINKAIFELDLLKPEIPIDEQNLVAAMIWALEFASFDHGRTDIADSVPALITTYIYNIGGDRLEYGAGRQMIDFGNLLLKGNFENEVHN